MHAVDHLYKLIEDSMKRSRESYKLKAKQSDKRTARASSLNNALQQVQKEIGDNGTVG